MLSETTKFHKNCVNETNCVVGFVRRIICSTMKFGQVSPCHCATIKCALDCEAESYQPNVYNIEQM